MIRIGILGAARIAPKAIIQPSLKRNDCRVVAVAARDAERAAAYAAEHFPNLSPAVRVVLLPEIPRSRTGSVDRGALMDAFDAGNKNVA